MFRGLFELLRLFAFGCLVLGFFGTVSLLIAIAPKELVIGIIGFLVIVAIGALTEAWLSL